VEADIQVISAELAVCSNSWQAVYSESWRYSPSEMSSHCLICKMSRFGGSVLLSGSPWGHDCPVLGTTFPLWD